MIMGMKIFLKDKFSGLSKKGDVFIGLTTSGTSINIIKAFKKQKILKLKTIAICGVMVSLKVILILILKFLYLLNNIFIQEMHGITTHLICDIVEKNIFSEIE